MSGWRLLGDILIKVAPLWKEKQLSPATLWTKHALAVGILSFTIHRQEYMHPKRVGLGAKDADAALTFIKQGR